MQCELTSRPWAGLWAAADHRGVDREAVFIRLWALAIYYRTGDDRPRFQLCRGVDGAVERVEVAITGDATLWTLSVDRLPRCAEEPCDHRLVIGPAPPHPLRAIAELVVSQAPLASNDVRCAWASDADEGLALGLLVERLGGWLSDHPDSVVAAIELMPPGEAGVAGVAGEEVEFDASATLHGLMFATATTVPDRIALQTTGGSLSYGELARRVRQVVRRLRRDGVKRGDRVGIIAHRSLAFPVALFGIMAAGAAYVPLDADAPAARLQEMIRLAGVSLVLTEGPAHSLDVRQQILEDSWWTDDTVDEGRGDPESSAEDLAYIIFTSGSTGVPKGVMVSHRSVVNRLHWMQRRYPLFPDDVVLQKTPAVFDVSVWELFWSSQVGATLYLIPPGHERFPMAIAEAISQAQATVMHFIPSMLEPFLNHLERQGGARPVVSLRQVFCSGEALLSATVRRFARILGQSGARLTNLYGPTEATVDVTYYDCPLDRDPPARIPIGRPIQNTRLQVLRHGRAVPVGVAGTLFVSGVCVARGYVSSPAQTQAVFVPDLEGDGLMYDTGDLVRWTRDGQLEFLGRCDAQIKIAGMRVEPEEIEQVAREHPGIDDCAIAVFGYGTNLVRLCAVLVSAGVLLESELREHFAARLPMHMVPGQYVRVAALPRTASGKLDRRRLATPEFLGGESIATRP